MSNKNITAFNFDHPDAFDNEFIIKQLEALKKFEEVDMPQYDFVHHRRMDSVEMDRVGMTSGINKSYTDAIAFHAAQAWTRDTPIVSPGGEEYSRSDFNFLINCGNIIFTQCLAVRQLAYLPIIPFV